MEQQKLVLQEQELTLGIRRTLALWTRLALSSYVEATIMVASQAHSSSAAAMVMPTATAVSALCV